MKLRRRRNGAIPAVSSTIASAIFEEPCILTPYFYVTHARLQDHYFRDRYRRAIIFSDTCIDGKLYFYQDHSACQVLLDGKLFCLLGIAVIEIL